MQSSRGAAGGGSLAAGGGGGEDFEATFFVSIGGEGDNGQGLEVVCKLGTLRVPAPFRPGTDGAAAPVIYVERPGQPQEEVRVARPYDCCGSAFSVQLAAFERAVLLGGELAYPLERSRDAVELAQNLRGLLLTSSGNP